MKRKKSRTKKTVKKAISRAKRDPKMSSAYAARIKVVGIGGGGGSAVSRMCDSMNVRGIEFIAINADTQALDYCQAKKKIYIGKNLTKGLGTGMNPDLGRQAAEENRSDIVEALQGADLVFLTIGLGGGCGSGAGAIVAEAARESGALTVAVVTKPFTFEGSQRARIAEEALIKLKDKVDTLIVVPNDRIFSIIKKETPLIKAFEYIDDVLRSAVQGIAELIASPGIVNIDFADVQSIMKDAGSALIGIGTGTGQERALNAVNQAINSPLLDISIDGAKGVLFGVAGSRDLRMTEINEIAKVISSSVDPGAKIIFGAYHDRRLKQGQIKVTLLATGFNGQLVHSIDSTPTSLFSEDITPLREQEPEQPKLPEIEDIKEERKQEKKDSDVWEIPTFLRKKK